MRDAAKDLADRLGPALTDALKKDKGVVTLDVRGAKGAIEQQSDSGFELNLAPSGSF